ncbi:MAG: ribonuclease HII [Firmicutes bacterium]|nr:ribonuclease HII [Bacillota bacterium]
MAKSDPNLRKQERYIAAYRFDEAVRSETGSRLIGVDEAGRGPLAGPVVAAAVILPEGWADAPFYDSKQLSARARESAYDLIVAGATAYGIGVVDPNFIDQYNILQATYEAMRQAVAQVSPQPQDLLLVDGTSIPGLMTPQRRMIRGDSISQVIAAASILAKVHRDRLMTQLAKQFPEFGFERHMGYGTPAHLNALSAHGPCAIHRLTFAPVRDRVGHVAADARAEREDNWGVSSTKACATSRHPRDPRQEVGLDAERWVVERLVKAGWRLREQRFRVVIGEVDAIFEDGDVLVFLEVRARTRLAEIGQMSADDALLLAAESVDARKRDRLGRLAGWYVAKHGLWQRDVRFDVVAVAWAEDEALRQMEHYRAAF